MLAARRRSERLRLRAAAPSGRGRRLRDRAPCRGPGALRWTARLALRSAKATDRYTLADDGGAALEPAFTFHGFRYADVDHLAELLGAEFLAISSDLAAARHVRRARIRRSTRFHANVLWSQRDNFVSVPTDCPQRDERLGWTGDAQAFAPTGGTLFDLPAFWASWLRRPGPGPG